MKLTSKAAKDSVVVARMHSLADRNAAEALKGRRLYAPREALPAIEAEDEFYASDLIGLAVEDRAGKRYGKVADVQHYGAGPMLAIAGESDFDLPFADGFVPVVDLQVGKIVIALPHSANRLDRLKQSLKVGVYSRMPDRLQQWFDGRQTVPMVPHTRRRIERIMDDAGFGERTVEHYACQSPLWNGVHLECRARKTSAAEAIPANARAERSISAAAEPVLSLERPLLLPPERFLLAAWRSTPSRPCSPSSPPACPPASRPCTP